jgi:hypothetical protein
MAKKTKKQKREFEMEILKIVKSYGVKTKGDLENLDDILMRYFNDEYIQYDENGEKNF